MQTLINQKAIEAPGAKSLFEGYGELCFGKYA
jgi:hypothetical protein